MLIGGIAGALTLGVLFAAFSGKPLMLVGLLVTGVFLRDTWAWLAATPDEREAFREQVIAGGGGPDQRAVGGHWRWWQLLVLGATTATCFAMMRTTPAMLPLAIMVLAVFVAAMVDRVRQALRARA